MRRILVSPKVKEVYTYALACHESWQLPETPTVCWQFPDSSQPGVLALVLLPSQLLLLVPFPARTFYWARESVGCRTLAGTWIGFGIYFWPSYLFISQLVNPSFASSSSMSFCCLFLLCYLIICTAFMKSSRLNLHTALAPGGASM